MDSVGSKTTILFGDLDEDGIIDNNDVSLLSNHLSGMADFTNAQEVLADVTGDGDIGIGDLTCISRVVGGQQSIEEMPIYSKLLDSGYCGKNGNNVKYMLKNGGTFIIFGEGEMADYSISSSAKNFVPWKQYAEQIKTVQVYDGVTSIGASAFQDYRSYETRYEKDSIEYVFLPSSLISIGDSAFLWCDTIEEIIIPNSVTSIGASAFAHCSKLSNITLSNNLSSISESLFEYCNSLKTISFPKSITTIGSWAFMDSGIETLTIPDTVQIIRDFSFRSLSLKEITFEGDIKTYSSAFSGATNLTKVVFNGKITFPKSDVGSLFNECKNLTYLKIPSVFSYEGRYYPIQSFMNFRGCDNLKFENITFNDKCKVIDGVLFSHDGKKLLWYNKDIKDSNYTIPDGVEEIDWQAFYGNNHIEHVVFSNTVKTLGGRAFQSCENLNNVIIPEGVEELFDFQFCTSLKRIVIPSSVNCMYQQDKNSTSTFERVRDIVFYCDHGSYCEQFIDEYSFLGEVRETVYCNFDANGGTVEKNKQAVIPQDKYWILPTPTRSGYDFDGWYTDKTGGIKITTESVVDPESSFTLFAHWITDDIEKPSVTLTATNDINPSQNVTIDLCDNIGIKGYYWGTSSSYSNNAYTTTSSTSISKTVDSAGTYYATAVDTSGNVSSTVSITFYKTTLNANGGSVSPTSVLTKSGNSFTFPTPTRSNYTYVGWSTYSSATSGVKTLSPSSNTTYYAVWSYVDSQKPTASLSSTNNVASSQTVTISMSDNVGIKGYYWGTSSSYSNNSYTSTSSTSISKTVDSAGTYYATAVDTSGNVSSTVSITFYKTTLNANGGSVSPTSVLTKSGNSFTFPTPTRSNYTYVGWGTSSSTSASNAVKTLSPSSNATYYAVWSYVDSQKPTASLSSTNNVASSQTVTISLSDNVGIKGYYWGTNSSYSNNSYTSTSSTSISKTVDSSGTYYATAVDTSGNVSSTVSITFYKTTLNANGGSVSPTSVLTKSGNSFTFPTPTRSNYTYVGWGTSSSASSGVKTLTPSSNITYYAVWQISYETISLDSTKAINITTGGTVRYFQFTPSRDVTVRFYSSGDKDTYGYIYDANLNLIDENDDDGENRNFTISHHLNAGTKYIFSCKLYDSSETGAFNITLKSFTKSEFIWGQDNWNFNNSSRQGYFKDSTYRDQINSTYLNTLKNNLTNSEYQAIFTGYWYYGEWYDAWLDDWWGGSCYGMSSLALLSKEGVLPYSSYKSSATKLHDLNYPKADSNVSSLVTYYQMLQVKDVIQQQYRTVKYRSNETNIKNIIELLDVNSTVLVGFRKDGWGGHAILATGYEYGSWTWNGVAYQGCIKICDPNCSLSYNNSYNIYFNTQSYNWTIPAYSGIKSVNGAVFNYIGSNVDEIIYGGYLSGTSNNKIDNYIARIDAVAISDNRTVTKVVEKNGSYVTQNSAPGDIIEDYSYVLGNESEGTIGYNLFDANASYKVSQPDAQELQLIMNYENCYLSGGSRAGASVIFNKNGYIQVEGESADYNMTMTFDDSYPTDWFTLAVSGETANSASLTMVDDGYILFSDNLKNVNVHANNMDNSASTTFSTDYDSVFIYEIDENTIGLKVDTDGNGTYETELPTNTFQIGDTDGDGNITISDVTEIQRHLAELIHFTDDQLILADTNGDGKVDIGDATHLQKYLAEFDGIILGKQNN